MKAFLAWMDELRVYVPDIDIQHREIFESVNRLYVATTQGTSVSDVVAIVERLIVDLRAHFACEEGWMKAVNYPGLSAHASKHCALLIQLDSFSNGIASGHLSGATKLAYVLKNWLIHHIAVSDLDYALHRPSALCAQPAVYYRGNYRV